MKTFVALASVVIASGSASLASAGVRTATFGPYKFKAGYVKFTVTHDDQRREVRVRGDANIKGIPIRGERVLRGADGNGFYMYERKTQLGGNALKWVIWVRPDQNGVDYNMRLESRPPRMDILNLRNKRITWKQATPPVEFQKRKVQVRIKLGPNYNYKTYRIDGKKFRIEKVGKYYTHTRYSKTGRLSIRYDAKLGEGSNYVSKNLSTGTYEFRRRGNQAYLVKVSSRI